MKFLCAQWPCISSRSCCLSWLLQAAMEKMHCRRSRFLGHSLTSLFWQLTWGRRLVLPVLLVPPATPPCTWRSLLPICSQASVITITPFLWLPAEGGCWAVYHEAEEWVPELRKALRVPWLPVDSGCYCACPWLAFGWVWEVHQQAQLQSVCCFSAHCLWNRQQEAFVSAYLTSVHFPFLSETFIVLYFSVASPLTDHQEGTYLIFVSKAL